MRQTIYIDVLICVNLFINYTILLAVTHIMNIKVKQIRLILGSLTGAAASLIILLPPLGAAVNILIKILLSILIVIIVYGKSDIKRCSKLVAAFFLTTFAFCGVMLALWYIIYPHGLTMRNSVIYINISPVMLIAFTLICYLTITAINRVTGRGAQYKLLNRLEVTINGKSIELLAKYDSGNSLKEPFSGLPVIVADRDIFADMVELPDISDVNELTKGRFRLIPFYSLGGDGLLPAIKADGIRLNGKEYDGECYIAFCEKKQLSGEFDALLGEDITAGR